MSQRRREVLDQAKALFRSASYAHVRSLIASTPSDGSSTEEAALLRLDECAARLLKEAGPPRAIPVHDPSDPVADDAVYWHAYGLWLDDNFTQAHQVLRGHAPLTNYYKVAFPYLRGWLFAGAGQLLQQLALTTQALTIALDDPDVDRRLLGLVALALATVARETPSANAHRLLERALEMLNGGDQSYAQLHIRRALAQVEALQGRYPTALRHLNFGAAFAREPLDRAFLHFDYALIATWAKQSSAAEAAFDVGVVALQEAQIENRTDEGAFAITVGAIAGIAIRPEIAREYAALAERIIPTISATWGAGHGGRTAAYIDEAVALTSADPEVVVKRGRRAGKALERMGFLWRAGRLASKMYSITGHASYLRRAERLLEHYKGGPLATSEDPVHLPPRLREILELIEHGNTIDEIAYTLGISSHTVRKHINRLHVHYHVRGRAQLLAKLSRLRSAS